MENKQLIKNKLSESEKLLTKGLPTYESKLQYLKELHKEIESKKQKNQFSFDHIPSPLHEDY